MRHPKPSFLRRAASTLPVALALLAPLAARAGDERVVCHYTYGGKTRTLSAAAVTSPYAVTPIKVYTYADRDGQAPRLIHQAVYAYPPATRRGGAYGFSGRQFVYEPVDESELEYWCELTTAAAPRSAPRSAR